MPAGRPPMEIDEETVEKLATIHCTVEEIAYVIGCSRDTIHRRFQEIIERGKAKGRAKLRRLQWQTAEKGNVAMLIFLGKEILGQGKMDLDPLKSVAEKLLTPAMTKEQAKKLLDEKKKTEGKATPA